jgi:hypothetical protein
VDPRLLMLTRFWLRVGGIALLFWCLYQVREDLRGYLMATLSGNWSYWPNTLPNLWYLSLSNPWTYVKLWWLVRFATSLYLVGWNAGLARLLWRGLWAAGGKCPKCGYDRSGLSAGKACPECGTT